MNVLQRSMIREMMDLNRELGSPLMICSFCWVHMDSALVNGNVLNVNGHLCFDIFGDAETKCPIPWFVYHYYVLQKFQGEIEPFAQMEYYKM